MQNGLRTTLSHLAWKLAPVHMHDRYLAHDKFAEREEDIIGDIVDPNRGSIDVGANLGRYTILLSKHTEFVIAFEPHHEVARLLKELVRRKGIDNVTIVEKAASSAADQTRPFFLPSEGTGHSTLEQTAQNGSTDVTEVTTATLDQLAGHDVGFVKIDVEGHEYDVLCGAKQFIEANSPTFLIEIETLVAPGQIALIREFFEERNYAGYYIYKNALHPIDAFEDRLQDRKALDWSRSRREMDFVNNFLFAPRGPASEQLAERIATGLTRSIS
ncbi:MULTISPECIES: FkbM family methyltransferase [unclassified Hyphomicrobium]|uniref:FkbM family methyltransferase n=1 Tax=unclassified Hyphomicrobium TaxID=2619925 RepID=UPI000213D345|nr:FkbM family methyltransferase [Hyphomicrobium sp. MC1]CCB64986.1 putative Methyltransferase FkbM family [Hyphomicrobium sp. MC1]